MPRVPSSPVFQAVRDGCSAFLACELLKRVNAVFNQVGSFPTPCPAETDLSALLLAATPVLTHQMELFQMGVRMMPEESLRNLLCTQAASVQSEEHPKQPLRVSDKNTQLHDPKVIPSAIMKKKELKGKESP